MTAAEAPAAPGGEPGTKQPAGGPAAVEYKVAETSVVSDDELTRLLNRNAREGWIFDGFQFAMREASHRPAMAFAVFHRAARDSGEGS